MFIGILALVTQYRSIIKDENEKTQEGNFQSSNNSENRNDNTNNVTIINEGNDENKTIETERKEMEDKTFILYEPERLMVLSNEDEKDIFYITDVNSEMKYEEQVKEHVEKIYEEKKVNTFIKGSLASEIASKAQTKEDVFLDDRNKALDYKQKDDINGWRYTVPNSNALENIMQERELLWKPEQEDMEFDGSLCFRLANNNQLMADEYMHQNGKPETVIYYYAKSITWTEHGLAYRDIADKDRELYYNYLKSRYKDIYDYIKKNQRCFGEEDRFQEIGEKAYAIYLAM